MQIKRLVTMSLLVLVAAVSGCKEEKGEVASPNCSNPAIASDASKCPRQDGNITRSQPKTWSMDSEKK